MISVRLGQTEGVGYNISGDGLRCDWVTNSKEVRSNTVGSMQVSVCGRWISLATAIERRLVIISDFGGELTYS